MNIEDTDRNFRVEEYGEDGLVWRSVRQEPFSVHGVFFEEDGFVRMPAEAAACVSPGVADLARHTAGGRIRFVTDSAVISVRVGLRRVSRMPHFTLCGCAGMDLYADGRFRGAFMPPYDVKDGYASRIVLEDRRKRKILIHLPLYSGVTEILIGLEEGSTAETALPLRPQAPVVFYGSSITQGGCASRPGNCFTNIIARKYDTDIVNLGFAGNAKGEDAMADYIAGLPMSAFVLDYDYNAPDLEWLERTHERFFLRIRERRPELPVVIASRPNVNLTEVARQRREVIRGTWLNALKRGDGRVVFVDGQQMMSLFGDDGGTVDNCHPNDLGFACMAEGFAAALKKLEVI